MNTLISREEKKEVDELLQFIRSIPPEKQKLVVAFGQGLSMQIPDVQPKDPKAG